MGRGLTAGAEGGGEDREGGEAEAVVGENEVVGTALASTDPPKAAGVAVAGEPVDAKEGGRLSTKLE